jgi:deoxyribonuclease-4
LDSYGINFVVVHAPYVVNPASLDPDKSERAHRVLSQEMRRAKRVSAAYVAVHPGHWDRTQSRPKAIVALSHTIQAMLSAPGRVLIENAAGQGAEIGDSWEELGEIFRLVGKTRRVGLLIDTAHVLARGQTLVTRDDVERLLELVDQTVGLARVRAVHLNDCAGAVGSRRDRHASLLQGTFGEAALCHLIQHANQRDWPLILETPGRDTASRAKDLALVRRLAGSISSVAE